MMDLLYEIDSWLTFTNLWLWVPLLSICLVAWLGVRIFMDPGRWHRNLSVTFSLLPVVAALVVAIVRRNQILNSFTFNRPEYLALLLVLPLVIWFSARSLSGLGNVRRSMAILLRCVIIILLAAALAETHFVRIADRLTVMFTIDYSLSIPNEKALPVREFVNHAIENKPAKDLAGVIWFGKEPRIEVPPLPGFELRDPEAEYDQYHTDVAAALKLAQASFSDDTMKRIVLITDGNENRGDALREAVAAEANGISIDVLPLEYQYDNEVQVERVNMPADVTKGETVNLNILVRSTGKIPGTLLLFRDANRKSLLIAKEHVELRRGINPFTVPQKIDEPNLYKFKAIFEPDDPSLDNEHRNNIYETFTNLPGDAKVMFIEGEAGENEALISALRAEDIKVEVFGADSIPATMTELRPYDSVILANLPREELTDQQMDMLAANTHDLGAGLIMIGGEHSFGAGGYIDSPIEKAMPVDMQIKNLKVTGKGALVLVMHACEIPEGNYWEKKVCKDALMTLSYNDEAGVVQSNGAPSWIFPLQTVKDKKRLLGRIDRLTARDMLSFDPTLIAARNALMKSDAMTKHIILTSDGDPQPPSAAVVRSIKAAKITITTVGVAVHGNDPSALRVLRNLARATMGRFHNVKNNNQLPKIFQKEARIISRPLIFERAEGWTPEIVLPTEPIAGLTSHQLPPIRGYVMTTPKQNELVDVPIISKRPPGTENPVLAHWYYGLGKSVAFTSDSGFKWTNGWTSWQNYRKFWGQLVRWSMRSVEGGNIKVSRVLEDGKIKIVADIIDEENNFVNRARIEGNFLDPDMKTHPLSLEQVAPGRYEGVIENAETTGIHFISLAARLPDGSTSQVVTGVTVPYPAEFRELKSHPGLLENIASVSNGKVIRESDAFRIDPDVDPFRHDLAPPRSLQELWHLLTFAAVILFFFDVATRRIAVDLSRARPTFSAAWAYVRGKRIDAPQTEYMDKLRSRKSEVSNKLERAKTTSRFEASPGTVVEDVTTEALPNKPAPSRQVAKPQVTPDGPEQEDTYTSRLLKAKKQVWKDKDQQKPQ